MNSSTFDPAPCAARPAARLRIVAGCAGLALIVASAVALGASGSSSKAASAPAIGATPAQAAGAGSGKAGAKPADKPSAGGVREIDWELLMPPDERGKFAGPPPPIHDYLGEGGMAAAQPMEFSVNKDLQGVNVKLPGFIVPLDVGKDGMVSEFFLVPYFGACIHVPPPPPNQIVYVKMKKGIALDSIYDAYWITGQMRVENKSTKLGAAAYAMDADKLEVYKY